MLNLFSPLSEKNEKAKRFQASRDLCRTLLTPGAPVHSPMDRQLAEFLLSRSCGESELHQASLNLLNTNAGIQNILDCAWSRDVPAMDRMLADGTIISFLNTPLMQALLYSTTIADLRMERLLTHVRRRLLECALDETWSADAETLKATLSVAAYTFLTEYVFAESEEESSRVATLCEQIARGGSAGADPFAIAVVGCYRPLYQLDQANDVKRTLLSQSNPLFHVLCRIQIVEPLREQDLAGLLPQLSDIEDQTSQKVRQMYEENPYPRWACYRHFAPIDLNQSLQQTGPALDRKIFENSEPADVLLAGCGTGLTLIEHAVAWRNARFTAVDLSRRSLAYGQRCAEEIGLESIAFYQGDILELPSLGRTFDYIGCGGVLHHMADPIAGWKALLECCRPGGVMDIAVYSETARRHVTAGRIYLRDFSDAWSPADVRAGRQKLIDHAFRTGELDSDFAHIFSTIDFFNLSMCRDLLMHVQEMNFTIPLLKQTVQDLGLVFRGFNSLRPESKEKYRAFAPDDENRTDLDSWARFEQENPQTFSGMYQFYVQKPAV